MRNNFLLKNSVITQFFLTDYINATIDYSQGMYVCVPHEPITTPKKYISARVGY